MSDTSPTRRPIGLIISIALNGLLIGLLAGVLLAGGPKQRGGPQGGGKGGGDGDRDMARAIFSAAPESERKAFREMMGEAWNNTQSERQAIREARAVITEAISADQLDTNSIAAEFEKWREADKSIKTNVQQAMVKMLEELSPESRKALAETMRQHDARRQKWRERRERRRDQEPPK